MEGMTREDALALRLEIAELRREMAELRREIAERELPKAVPINPFLKEAPARKGDEISDEQIYTEWTEGEDAWKAKEKR